MSKYVHPLYRETKTPDEYQRTVDFQQGLVDTYRSEARWEKGIQRLREAGKLANEPRDIGPLIGVIVKDIEEECGEEIRRKLWKRYWPHVARGCTGGFAEYYKRKLMEGAFAQDSQAVDVQATPQGNGLDAEQARCNEHPVLGEAHPEPRPAAAIGPVAIGGAVEGA